MIIDIRGKYYDVVVLEGGGVEDEEEEEEEEGEEFKEMEKAMTEVLGKCRVRDEK